MKHIIAIAGNGPRAGKSTVAKMMRNTVEILTTDDREAQRPVVIAPIAETLKSMLREITGYDDYGAVVDGEKTARPDSLCGKSVREALQTLGTEWGRKCIGSDIWINNWIKNHWEGAFYENPLYIIDDLRFLNELKKLKELGAYIIYVARGVVETTNHESEGQINQDDCDSVIYNNDTLSKLNTDVFNAAEDVLCKFSAKDREEAAPNTPHSTIADEKPLAVERHRTEQGEAICPLTADSPVPCPCYESPYVHMVSEFQRTFDPKNLSYNKDRLDELPADKLNALFDLRCKLIDEEFRELKASMSEYLNQTLWFDDPTALKASKREILDALADLIVVTIGTALAFGLDIDTAMARVHASNMSKLGADGKPIYREDGKVMKGPHYKKPELEDLI